MNGGDYRTTGPWAGIRAAVNARLEEVSFRTGMAAGAVTLLVVAAATAAVVLTVLPSQGSPVSRAAVTPVTASSRAAALVPTASATTPAAAPTPRASVSHPPKASTAPAAGAQSGQYSPDAAPAGRGNPAGGTFGAHVRGRGTPGGHWPGRWGGSPRYGGTTVFTGALFRPAPRGGPGRFGR